MDLHNFEKGDIEPSKRQSTLLSLVFLLNITIVLDCELKVYLINVELFFPAIKGIKFQRKHAKLSEHLLDEQMKILDKLGDLYCQAKAYHKALGCYKKEVLSYDYICTLTIVPLECTPVTIYL